MLPARKLMFVFGTRPEAIKMAPLISAFSGYKEIFETLVVVTGQHRQMLDQVLAIFQINPDYDLEIMQKEQIISEIVVKTLQGLENILLAENPDLVFVQGDTSTAFAAALAAFYKKIPVAHVEAGLRTYHKYQPFPEEINRKMISAVADLNFAPTARAGQNLLKEGCDKNSIFVTGNTGIDALKNIAGRSFNPRQLGIPSDGKKLILLTAHRRENFGAPMRQICAAVKKIIENSSETVRIIMPVHLNPQVKIAVSEILGQTPNVILRDPLSYEELIHFMKMSYLVLTDSGGIQEEAPALGKPVLVLREVTERPEAIEAGTAKIVGTDQQKIISEVEKLLRDSRAYHQMANAVNPYGDGHASERIVDLTLYYFGYTDVKPKEFSVCGDL